MSPLFLKHFWISPRLLALYAPLSLTAVPVALIQVEIGLLDLLIIATSVTAFACGLLALAIPVERVLRLSGVGRTVFFTIFVLFVGAMRGGVLVSIAELLEIADPVSLEARVINSVLNTAFWVVLLAGLIALVRENIERYEQNFAEKTLETAGQIEASPDLLALKIDSMPHLLNLKENLTRVLENLDSSRFSERELLISANAIRSEIENSLRPFSHRIWFSEALARPKLRGSGLLTEALRRPQFAPLTSAVLLAVWFGVGALPILSLGSVLIGAIATGFSTLLIASLASKIVGARQLNLGWGLLLLGAASALIYLGTLLAVVSSETQEVAINSFISGVLFPAANFLVLVISSLLIQMRNTYQVIEGLLESAANLASSRLRSQFASYLHNSLQAELSSLAGQLEKASRSPGKSDTALRQRLEEISGRSIGADFANRGLRPAERLAKVIAAWEGIIEIKFDRASLLGIGDQALQTIVELFEESIANAVRHAAAPWIQFELEPQEAGFLVTITSPGHTQNAGPESMGSSWLQAHASKLSIEEQPEGIRVTRVTI